MENEISLQDLLDWEFNNGESVLEELNLCMSVYKFGVYLLAENKDLDPKEFKLLSRIGLTEMFNLYDTTKGEIEDISNYDEFLDNIIYFLKGDDVQREKVFNYLNL